MSRPNLPKKPIKAPWLLLTAMSLFAGTIPALASEIPIVVAPSADTCERWAASEISRFLGEFHPGDSFPIVESAPEKASLDGGPTRGELGILIQHNLKWLNMKSKDQKATDAN